MDERQMTMLPVFIAGVLLLAALILWLNTRAQRRLGGLPAGELIYADTDLEQLHRYSPRGRCFKYGLAQQSVDLVPLLHLLNTDDASLESNGDGLRAVAAAQLRENIARVDPNRALADSEARRDLLIRLAVRDEPQDFRFPRAEFRAGDRDILRPIFAPLR